MCRCASPTIPRPNGPMRSMNHYAAQTATVAVRHYVRLRNTVANEMRVA